MIKGAIGFSSSNSWIGKAIRWFRNSDINHTFIILCDSEHIFTIEAGKREVAIYPYKKRYKNDTVQLYLPVLNSDRISHAIDQTFPYIEKSYGYLQIIGIALISLLKKIGINIKNPIRTGIICSELVLLYLKNLGFHEFDCLDRDTVAPDDLLRIIENSDKFVSIENGL